MGKVKAIVDMLIVELETVSIPNGKGKDIMISKGLNMVIREYQFPMGKVKKFMFVYV